MTVWYKYFIVATCFLLAMPIKAQSLDCNNAASAFYLADITDSTYVSTARYAMTYDFMDSLVNLQMDIYRPGPKDNIPFNGSKPAVILLYGGGFKQRGDIQSGFFVEMANYLAKKGFVVSVPYYRTGWN